MADLDLVSLDEVKQALAVDGDDRDGALALYISAASSAVLQHVKDQAEPYLNGDGDIADASLVPAEWRNAVILLVGQFLRNPDGDPDHDFAEGNLPAPVVALLRPYRDPTFA